MALSDLPAPDAKRSTVREMFDRIAPRYDLLNRLLSAGMDRRWRRRALDLAEVRPGDTVVDLACGTGDMAEGAAARGARVLGLDFAKAMLAEAKHRGIDADWVAADAAALPFRDASVQVVTCGFALRNFVSLPEVLGEIARILAPGGRFVLVEVDRPRSPLLRRLHSIHFDWLVPQVGGLLSDRRAYRYLPASTVYLPPESELLAELRERGLERVTKETLFFGSAQILHGRRPGAAK